jgi:hypothetical protein
MNLFYQKIRDLKFQQERKRNNMKEEIRVRQQEYKVYITSDGKEFTNKREAEKHEIKIMPEKQIPRFFITLEAIEEYGYCYKIESEADLDYLYGMSDDACFSSVVHMHECIGLVPRN